MTKLIQALLILTVSGVSSFGFAETVETRIGTLEFKGGYPTEATIQKAFDQLDVQRATQAYLEFMPMMSVQSIFESHIRDNGMAAGDVGVYIEQGVGKSSTIGLTYNTESIYASAFTDLKKQGPVVVETPPNVLGVVDDGWQRWLTDLGKTQDRTREKGANTFSCLLAIKARCPRAILSSTVRPTGIG